MWFKKRNRKHTSKFAKKADLASLKSEIDKLDIDDLKSAPLDLSKLSDLVKNKVMYDELDEKDMYN